MTVFHGVIGHQTLNSAEKRLSPLRTILFDYYISKYTQPRTTVTKVEVSLQYSQKVGEDPSRLQILLSIPLL